MADWGSTLFSSMYKASSLLLGFGLSKATATPGVLQILTGAADKMAVPAAGGLMVALQIPTFVMNIHSTHFLILFQVLRAEGKYAEKRDQMRNIQKSMDTIQKTIREAISTTGTAPESMPTAAASIMLDPARYVAYLKEVEDAGKNVTAYVRVLDAVLDDIEKCLVQWNTFLAATRKSQAEDRPRTVFEKIGFYSVERERDWAWYKDETGFSSACNELLKHRESWAKVNNFERWGSLTQLTFAN